MNSMVGATVHKRVSVWLMGSKIRAWEEDGGLGGGGFEDLGLL